jgi:hypothetical protein
MTMSTEKRTGYEQLLWAFLLTVVTGCVGTSERTEDGQTHWLETCEVDSACGANLACVCGHCVARCEANNACSVNGMETLCAGAESPAVKLLCGEQAAPSALCLEVCEERSDCDDDQRCLDNHCVPNISPPSETATDAGSVPVPMETGAEPSTSANDAGSSSSSSSEPPEPVGNGCRDQVIDDCSSIGCGTVVGWETIEGALGAYYNYGCFEPNEDCPEEGVCARDPENNDHVVWFSTCAPLGWNPDRSSPNACADFDGSKCASLGEPACNSTPMCSALYGREVDGSDAFATCMPAGTLTLTSSRICAAALYGRYLDLPVAELPEGWSQGGPGQCAMECFSPWINAERAGELPGCPCTTYGDVCLEGVGMACEDPTDDLTNDPRWSLSDSVCDNKPDCDAGGTFLQECLDTYEVCTESGSIVLDKGTPLYCGAEPLACQLTANCGDGCRTLSGVTPSGSEVGVCVDYFHCEMLEAQPLCVSRTSDFGYRAEDEEPVLVETCAAPAGWLDVGLEACSGGAVTECADRDEAACTPPCAPFVGRRAPGAEGEFVACGEEECTSSITVCAQNDSGDVVEFFGCVAPGYTPVDATACQGDAGGG